MAIEKEAKTILNKKKQRDSWFLDDYTLNPYSGCSFNCLFCYIRGSRYGHKMERKLAVKTNAVELLDKELSKRATKEQYGFIVLASATDPYLQLEEDYQLTRQLLEVILQHRFPVHIITRSKLVERDFDLLKQIDQTAILPQDLRPHLNRGTLMTFSFSTLDDEVASVFEPGAPPPSERLETVSKSIAAGFHTGISLMPLLPFISDTTQHLEESFSTFKELGVHYLMPASLTLFGDGPADSKTLTMRAIAKHFPELVPRYEKYFAQSTEMPGYYRKAFEQKMGEMAQRFGLPDRIVRL